MVFGGCSCGTQRWAVLLLTGREKTKRVSKERVKFPVSPSPHPGSRTGCSGSCAGAQGAVGERGSSASFLKGNFQKQGIHRDSKTTRPREQERPPRAGEAGCLRAGRTCRTYKGSKQGL